MTCTFYTAHISKSDVHARAKESAINPVWPWHKTF